MNNVVEALEINARAKSRPGRYFFVVMASVFIILAVIGFENSHLAIIKSNMKLHWFAYIHGVIMGSWLLILLTQTILAAKGNLKLHKQLGLLSVGLAVLVWLSMCIATIRRIIAISPPIDAQDYQWDVLLLNFYGIILFGLFCLWGILVRKKAAMHKRLLFFATAVLIQAAIDRMNFLPWMYETEFIRFIYLDVLLILPLFIYDFVTIKRIHKITKTGAMIFIVFQIAITMAFGTTSWHKFCFNLFSPFTEKVVEVKLSDDQIAPLLGDYGEKKGDLSIYQKDAKLYLKIGGWTSFEMGATAENEFFLRTMTWKVSFIRGKDGRVLKLINKQPDVTWEAKRLR